MYLFEKQAFISFQMSIILFIFAQIMNFNIPGRYFFGVLVILSLNVNSQNKKLLHNLEKLPIELRVDFVKEQLPEMYKRDTASTRKQVDEVLVNFKSDKALCATILLAKGIYLFKAAKTEDAIVPVHEAEKLFVQINNRKGEFLALSHLINMYRELNRTDVVIDFILKKLKTSGNDHVRECTLYEKLGIIFKDQGNSKKGLSYFELAQEKFDLIENVGEEERNIEIAIQRNMGVLYRNNKELDKALFHLNKALALAEENNSDYLKASVLNSLGTLYRLRKDYYKAIQVYEESLKLKAEVEHTAGLSTTSSNLASLYLEINNFIKAEQYALSAYKYGSEARDRIKILNACEQLSNVYEKMNKHAKAFPYMKRAFFLSDSVYKVSIVEQSAALEAKYDSDKKKKEIELSKLQNQQLEESVKARKRERNMILGGSVVLIVLLVFAIKSFLDKNKANKQLEEKNSLIGAQKHMVEEQHKEILDSITYAKRLQDAILPPDAELKEVLKEYFIYYQPKSIVAGDFYWMETFNDTVLIAVADCTGHGVPGAMVSLVCSNALNRSVFEYGIKDPGKILDKTRELVLYNFGKNQTDVKDGMDISLLSINRKTKEVQWAGANNPLWIIKNNQFSELTANKQPVGKAYSYEPFTTHNLVLEKGDSLFLFSDGYADQFGGPRGKKLKYKQMQEILVEGSGMDLMFTEQRVKQKFVEWMGELEQVDDVCVLGVRI